MESGRGGREVIHGKRKRGKRGYSWKAEEGEERLFMESGVIGSFQNHFKAESILPIQIIFL